MALAMIFPWCTVRILRTRANLYTHWVRAEHGGSHLDPLGRVGAEYGESQHTHWVRNGIVRSGENHGF